MNKDIASANLFMVCIKQNDAAAAGLPSGFHIRRIRQDELCVWKKMPFDDEKTAADYYEYMGEWFERVYAPRASEFYDSCLFACDENDMPVGTCFLWKAYGAIPTVQWFKVLKSHEGRGIGRALLSEAMKGARCPVYLHTQPGSFRAIKLYSDFGFSLLLDPAVGNRQNDIDIALPYLKKHIPDSDYRNLRFAYAPESFLQIVAQHETDEF